jgi:hypothetical protein
VPGDLPVERAVLVFEPEYRDRGRIDLRRRREYFGRGRIDLRGGRKESGVGAIAQPGGSLKDAEVIAAADEHGVAMVLTGVRHFRH